MKPRLVEVEPLPKFAGFTTWPVTFDPRPHEDLESWIVRIALANGQTPSMILRLMEHAGILLHGTSTVRAAEAVAYLAEKTDVDADRLWARGRLCDGILRRGCASRLCPVCLHEDRDPYARRAWQLPFAVGCPRHDVLLLEKCPGCQAPFRLMERSVPLPFGHCEACGKRPDPDVKVYPRDTFVDQANLARFVLLAQAIDRKGNLGPFFANIFRKFPKMFRGDHRGSLSLKNLPLARKMALSRVHAKELEDKLKALNDDWRQARWLLRESLLQVLVWTDARLAPYNPRPQRPDGLLINRISYPPGQGELGLYELLSSYGEARATRQFGPSRTGTAAR